jgi:hypothetical protein
MVIVLVVKVVGIDKIKTFSQLYFYRVPMGAVAVGTVAVTTAAAHVRHGYFFTKVHGALHVKVFLTEELLQEVHDLLVFIGLGRGGEKAESEGEHLHWRLYEELARK